MSTIDSKPSAITASTVKVTRKGRFTVAGGSRHDTLEEAYEDAGNVALASPGVVVTVTPPNYEFVARVATPAPAPAPQPAPAPAPAPAPTPTPTPAEPPASGEPATAVGQNLVVSKSVVMVGESFTVEGTLQLSDGTSCPVSTYRLYGYDKKLLVQPGNVWVPQFTAIEAGTTTIANDNQHTTAKVSVTVIPNDGTVFPPPVAPPPSTSPTPAPGGSPSAPGAPQTPAPSVLTLAVPVSPVGSGAHRVIASVRDGARRRWFAVAHVGDDPAAPGLVACFVNDAGDVHPRLQGTFYADCCHVAVNRMDNAFDEVGCTELAVTYDDAPVEVPASSYPDGTYAFWRGCWMPAIRYGKQVEFTDLGPIDWSILPDYTDEAQAPYSIDKFDFTWNGVGATSTRAMGTTGERPEIGYMQTLYMAYLLNPSEATWKAARKAEDWSGNWRMVHVCEPATGGIIKYDAYPMATILPWQQSGTWQSRNPIATYGGSYNGDVLTPPVDGWQSSACPFPANGAHLTSYGKLASMLTGCAHDRDNMSFWANFTLLEINPISTRTGGCMLGAQRRAAWCLGSLFVGAYTSSHREYFDAEVDRNIAIANSIPKNQWGILDTDLPYVGKGDADDYKGIAPWMQSYLAMTFNAVAKKKPQAVPFARYLGLFEVTWASKPYHLCRTVYNFMIHDPAGKMLTSFEEMTKRSLCNNGWTEEDADALVAAKSVEEAYAITVTDLARSGKAPQGKCVAGVADFIGNPLSHDSYPAGAIASIVAAANVGTPSIGAAVAYINNLPTRPIFVPDQKYHLTLRAA